jgi:tetratricopeptide (TPR) repeat protein
MNKRLEMLEKLTNSGPADAFAYYALGLEYRKEGRIDEALTAFSTLKARDAGYLPMYLMAGQMLVEAQRPAEARTWLEARLELARARGDDKTAGELEAELANTT